MDDSSSDEEIHDEPDKETHDEPIWRGPKTGWRGPRGSIGRGGEKGERGERGEPGRPGRILGREHPTFMGRIYLLGLYRGTWALFAYIAMAAMIIFLFHRQDTILDGLEEVAEGNVATLARLEQSSIDNDYLSCLSGNKVRASTRALVITATSGNSSTNLTQLPSYDSIADPAVRRWIREMEQRNTGQNNEDPNSFRQRGLRDLVDRDCDRLYPNRTPGIKLPD